MLRRKVRIAEKDPDRKFVRVQLRGRIMDWEKTGKLGSDTVQDIIAVYRTKEEGGRGRRFGAS